MGWFSATSLSFKILFYLGVAAIIAATSAKITHDYVATGYQNIILTAKVAVVERERKVEVLDKKALETALSSARARWDRDQKEKEVLNAIIESHKETPAVPWCGLDSYELCIWNRGNRFDIQDSPDGIPGCSKELPGTTDGGNGRPLNSVGK